MLIAKDRVGFYEKHLQGHENKQKLKGHGTHLQGRRRLMSGRRWQQQHGNRAVAHTADERPSSITADDAADEQQLHTHQPVCVLMSAKVICHSTCGRGNCIAAERCVGTSSV
jgi:hypothetical protein